MRSLRGFFREVFHHVEDYGPLHLFTAIPTASGATSTTTAQPRIGVAGERSNRTGSHGLTAVIRVRVHATMRMRCIGLGIPRLVASLTIPVPSY